MRANVQGYLFDRVAILPAWILWSNKGLSGIFTSAKLAMDLLRNKYPSIIILWDEEDGWWTGISDVGQWVLQPIYLDQEIEIK